MAVDIYTLKDYLVETVCFYFLFCFVCTNFYFKTPADAS